MIFLTSDQHFGHKNIIRYCQRPFAFSDEGVKECDDFMIKRYNEVVGPHDYVIFVGDVVFSNKSHDEHYLKKISSLNGHKILVKGNHDNKSRNFYHECGFIDVLPYLRFNEFFICHYPFVADPFAKEEIESESELRRSFLNSGCTTLIHGHVHNKSISAADNIQRINVCVDAPLNDFKPVQVKGLPEREIVEFIKAKEGTIKEILP